MLITITSGEYSDFRLHGTFAVPMETSDEFKIWAARVIEAGNRERSKDHGYEINPGSLSDWDGIGGTASLLEAIRREGWPEVSETVHLGDYELWDDQS